MKQALNPFLPLNEYVPDGEGELYLTWHGTGSTELLSLRFEGER